MKLYIIKKFNILKYKNNILIPDYKRLSLNNAKNEDYLNEQYLSIALLRYILITKYNLENNFLIDIDESQKPFLVNNELKYSLSHNQDYIIIGISKVELGVDIESLERSIKSIKFKVKDQRLENKSNIEKWVLLESAHKLSKRGISGIIKGDLINDIYFNELYYDNHIIVTASYERINYELIVVNKGEIINFISKKNT